MSDAERTPTSEDGVRSSLVRNLAGAAGVIVVVAAAFWGIGELTGEGGTPEVVDDPDVAAPADDAEGDAPAEDGDAPADDGDAPADDGDAPADDGDTESADADGAEADGGGDDTDADGDGGEGADAGDGDDADGDAEVERSVAPADVSLQVLDGVKSDGGAAADEVATILGDAGYPIVARNDALDYEVTTVLYNPGNEGAAQQIADELGGAEVREQPGNLSTEVDVHVVVGRDRA